MSESTDLLAGMDKNLLVDAYIVSTVLIVEGARLQKASRLEQALALDIPFADRTLQNANALLAGARLGGREQRLRVALTFLSFSDSEVEHFRLIPLNLLHLDTGDHLLGWGEPE